MAKFTHSAPLFRRFSPLPAGPEGSRPSHLPLYCIPSPPPFLLDRRGAVQEGEVGLLKPCTLLVLNRGVGTPPAFISNPPFIKQPIFWWPTELGERWLCWFVQGEGRGFDPPLHYRRRHFLRNGKGCFIASFLASCTLPVQHFCFL